jgi:hypothetical protein
VASIHTLVLRLRVMVSRPRLDHDLALGADPFARPALALRATQLLRPKCRRWLASALERLIAEADRGEPTLSAAVPFRRDQVQRARGTLLALAQVLRGAEPVSARGVAMTWELLSDPGSPLYAATDPDALHERAEDAREELVNV